ncbi:MAG: porin [Candidatus Binatia bacterium]|nr:MAG: porin [Candidatus Binatia bacterium]
MHISSVWTWPAVALVSLAGIMAASPSASGAGESANEKIERRLKELEESVRELTRNSRKLEVAEESRANQKPVAGWQDGFFLQTQDGSYQLRLGGYTHFDGRFFVGGKTSGSTSQFSARRVRVDLTGTVARYLKFRLLPDFAGSTLVLQDAYIDAAYAPWAQIRAGKTKTPYGIERLQSATAIYFVERSIADNLVPNRDLGVQVFGDLWLRRISYSVGLWNGVADGASSDTNPGDDFDFAGRLFLHPFSVQRIAALRGLGIGMAGTHGRETGTPNSPNLPTFRTPGRATFFRFAADSPATAAGTTVAHGARSRYSPQAYYYWGPFGALGEFNTTIQTVNKGSAEKSLTFRGWQVQASWVLTGENATYHGVTPAQPLDPFGAKWGAFQVAFRFAHIEADGATFALGFADPKHSASAAKQFSLGVNWYLNSNIKLVINYDRTWFRGGAADGDRKSENVILTRVQLAF